MTNLETTGTIDGATAERLSKGFADAFENFVADPEVFAADAFFDLNMPVWRFQLQGAESFARQLQSIAKGEVKLDILRTVATNSGFVTEHQEHTYADGEEFTARRLWLCQVAAGRIVEATGYCSGEWDEELRARHAIEAPMLRQ